MSPQNLVIYKFISRREFYQGKINYGPREIKVEKISKTMKPKRNKMCSELLTFLRSLHMCVFFKTPSKFIQKGQSAHSDSPFMLIWLNIHPLFREIPQFREFNEFLRVLMSISTLSGAFSFDVLRLGEMRSFSLTIPSNIDFEIYIMNHYLDTFLALQCAFKSSYFDDKDKLAKKDLPFPERAAVTSISGRNRF